MKNIFKMMGVALLACSMIMVSCKKDDDNSGDGNTNPTYSATFDGTALDIAGYNNAQCAQGQEYFIWLFQAAQRAEGSSVYFPYLVNYMIGESAADLDVADLELYKETYYQGGSGYYGDWQLYDVTNLNTTKVDMTQHTLSFTATCSMYSLTDIVEGNADDEEGATKANLVLSLNNMAYAVAE